MRKNYTFRNLATALLLWASVSVFSQTFENGVFVLNEGGAGSGNASVSFLGGNPVTVQNNIYQTANPTLESLGDTAQSMSFNGQNAYIVLNVSNTVKVMDRYSLEHIATVSEGLNNPRYMAFAAGKAFITNWGSGTNSDDDYLAVLNLETNSVESTISLGEGVERIFNINEKLYVLHQGGYGQGTTVSVVDPLAGELLDTIVVGDVPNSALYEGGFLYILCGGNPIWSGNPTEGSLHKIDLSTDEVIDSYTLTGLNPANLESTGTGEIFFSSEAGVYSATLDEMGADAQLLFSLEDQGVYGFYGMDLIDGDLFVADAGNYVSEGNAYVFSTEGTQLDVFQVGVIPNGFYKAEPNLSVPSSDAALTLSAWPNPTTDRFFVNSDEVVQVTLFDISGRLVLQADASSEKAVDVSGLPSGLYLTKIVSDSATQTLKIQKK